MNIGFVGLGAMGALIVPRLMAAGHKVTGWNRSRDKAEPLIAAGMAFAATPRAVAEASDIVFSIVTDSAAVKAVALGPDGIVSGLRKGGIYIDMSTIEPDASRAIAAQFAKAGSIMLDGPLSGSPVTVKAGQASVMIGGDAVAFERAKPVLLAIGPKVTRIGGISREAAVDAILKSVAAAPVLGYRGPFILDGQMPEVPLADVTLQQKDMVLALNLARQLGSPTPLAAAANEMMNACRGLGIDGNDFVVAHQVYRRLGGQDSGGQS